MIKKIFFVIAFAAAAVAASALVKPGVETLCATMASRCSKGSAWV